MTLTHFDPQDDLRIRVNGVYERKETDFVKATLKPGMTFIDCGAHIGYYSALAAELVGPTGRVHSFEPNPQLADILERNMAGYGAGVSVNRMALSDHVGEARLYLNPNWLPDNRLHQPGSWESVPVRMTTLDEALPDVVADFIKIDVQGEECRVLNGARKLIERSPSLCGIVEYSPPHLALAGSSGAELIALLKEIGFSVFSYHGPKLKEVTPQRMRKTRTNTNFIIRRRG
jgi:FkbM family methyltransferase